MSAAASILSKPGHSIRTSGCIVAALVDLIERGELAVLALRADSIAAN